MKGIKMIILSPQIEKTKRVLDKITQSNQDTLVLENQLIIMEKLKEIHSILELIKNK